MGMDLNSYALWCGCWIVADGNNRVGLILKKNPEATIAEIPERLLATVRFGEWDAEMMDWWWRSVTTKAPGISRKDCPEISRPAR
jgi:hypothetical protein